MKRLVAVFMCLALLMSAALPTFARRHYRRHYTRTYYGSVHHRRHGARYRRRWRRNHARSLYGRGYTSRRAYYSYGSPHRTFWQKHRDKLTVAMGTGAGALLGGAIGGKKGAGIGALAGAGGSALYTYGLRRRHRRY